MSVEVPIIFNSYNGFVRARNETVLDSSKDFNKQRVWVSLSDDC